MDIFFIFVWQSVDEIGQVYIFGSFLDVGIMDTCGSKLDVAFDGAGKQERILQHHAISAAKVGPIHVLDIYSVNSDCTLLDIIETQEQRNNRRSEEHTSELQS